VTWHTLAPYALAAGSGAAVSLLLDLVIIPIWKKARRK
jgi:hypothetical protein